MSEESNPNEPKTPPVSTSANPSGSTPPQETAPKEPISGNISNNPPISNEIPHPVAPPQSTPQQNPINVNPPANGAPCAPNPTLPINPPKRNQKKKPSPLPSRNESSELADKNHRFPIPIEQTIANLISSAAQRPAILGGRPPSIQNAAIQISQVPANTMNIQPNHNIRNQKMAGPVVINNKVILNQMKQTIPNPSYPDHTQPLNDILMCLDGDSLNLICNLLEFKCQNMNIPQKIESLNIHISSHISNVVPNFRNLLTFLINQIQNKTAFYQSIAHGKLPLIFRVAPECPPVYKFSPLNKRQFDVSPNRNIKGEYAIIAKIYPPNPSISNLPITVNGQPIYSTTFGESTEDKFFLLAANSINHNSLSIKLNSKPSASPYWVVIYYVVLVDLPLIEKSLNLVTNNIRGYKTDKCLEKCIFNFNDVVHNIATLGHAICPDCKAPVMLNKLVPMRISAKNSSYPDLLATLIAPSNDKCFFQELNFFTEPIKTYGITPNDLCEATDDQNDKGNNVEIENEFSLGAYINELENDISTYNLFE
ncbi:hypothetical protein TRFO_16926 [Tritrichomonas foetus]|uniref:Uncharacterized protein n=1 Tax=Tritrichomonas foetus TaxID=1144522 RepID=A0A1J4KPE6_9EUKA|nr:hypothetical protein TRFO_16926 [Tritrichomonas foetus]|eukprot:OHT12978.1 hypothetical protein TRFO_16926 [Tritrichomonas foetus]